MKFIQKVISPKYKRTYVSQLLGESIRIGFSIGDNVRIFQKKERLFITAQEGKTRFSFLRKASISNTNGRAQIYLPHSWIRDYLKGNDYVLAEYSTDGISISPFNPERFESYILKGRVENEGESEQDNQAPL